MFPARYLYLIGRAGATIASLILALGYSRDLGLVNRSSISMIMSTNALLWVVLTSGATLTMRKIGWVNAGNPIVRSFASVLAGQFILIIFVFLLVVNLYSQFKNPIALNLIFLSLIYVTSSGVHLVLMELLLSSGRFRSAGFLEILTILIQFALYILSSRITHLSVASRLLLAFSISYLVISMVALYLVAKTKRYNFGFDSPVGFIQRSRYNHVLGASLGFMDRADRILIGFLLATPILGKYAVATTLIALLRFFPDALSKLIMAKKMTLRKFDRVPRELILLFGIVFAGIIVVLSREIINLWLGPEWVLAIPIYVAIAFQELSRGYFQVVANQKILLNFSKIVHKVAIFMPLVAILTSFLGVKAFGLITIPLVFCATYLMGIILMRRNLTS
jgi:O-antigen/teichoic acid export membrane protein